MDTIRFAAPAMIDLNRERSTVLIARQQSTPEGTFGKLYIHGAFFCHTLELPWLDNAQRRSCVPDGKYFVEWMRSPRFGWVYSLVGVPNRRDIRIHPANLAGDRASGWKSQLEGCIALGEHVGKLGKQHAVLSSRAAVRRFADEMERKPFVLRIFSSGRKAWFH